LFIIPKPSGRGVQWQDILAFDDPKDPHGERFSYSELFTSTLIARTDKFGILRPEAEESD
jgi:hypothetical protein